MSKAVTPAARRRGGAPGYRSDRVQVGQQVARHVPLGANKKGGVRVREHDEGECVRADYLESAALFINILCAWLERACFDMWHCMRAGVRRRVGAAAAAAVCCDAVEAAAEAAEAAAEAAALASASTTCASLTRRSMAAACVLSSSSSLVAKGLEGCSHGSKPGEH